MRQKKLKKEVKKEEPTETQSQDDDASSGSGAEPKEITTSVTMTQSSKPNYLHNEFIYDGNMLYDTMIKMSNPNYAGNQSLIWGKIKVQLQTKSLEELRRKFHELNVTLRQIGVDEEKSFVDERILIGERLL